MGILNCPFVHFNRFESSYFNLIFADGTYSALPVFMLVSSILTTILSSGRLRRDPPTSHFALSFTGLSPTLPERAFLPLHPPLNGVAYPPNGRVQDKLFEPRLVSSTQLTSKIITLPKRIEREGFDMRAFIKEFELNPALGGSVHMFKEVWDE
ncbi:hypothetical protein DL96DRAFT_1564512 [Flagelloscypha sp. PMI_526]|nr:hypothetical protein DL96DRAFT_1564512 [Flagelloscypha sp. PMI_526]